MDAIVLTGGVASGDGGPKAYWPVRGRAMVEYVLEALSGVSGIGRVITVGHAPTGKVFTATEQVIASGTIVDHLRAALQFLDCPESEHILIATCDVPLLTESVVEDFLVRCHPLDRDLYYPVVRREDCERELAGMRRTYVKLREGTFTGGNLFLVRNDALYRILPFLERFLRYRKNPWLLSRELGWSFTVRLAASRLAGVLSMGQVEARVMELFAVRAKAVVCPHVAIGADVDDPGDLKWVEQALEERLS